MRVLFNWSHITLLCNHRMYKTKLYLMCNMVIVIQFVAQHF